VNSKAISFAALGVRVRRALLTGACAVALVLTGALPLPAQSSGSLPIYSVVRAGALPAEAATLESRLNIPAGAFVLTNGEMHFVDPARFMAAPVLPVTDPAVQSYLLPLL
jgi:hypothetical protein